MIWVLVALACGIILGVSLSVAFIEKPSSIPILQLKYLVERASEVGSQHPITLMKRKGLWEVDGPFDVIGGQWIESDSLEGVLSDGYQAARSIAGGRGQFPESWEE